MKSKNTFFHTKQTLNCGGKLLDLSSPIIMGIINVTPDSFFDGGKHNSLKKILSLAKKHMAEGAGILDVGGCSTRPNAAKVSEKEEMNRVIPAIKTIIKYFPDAIISIDTFRATVAKNAVCAGAKIINDISGGSFDKKMFQTVSSLNIPYILTHIKGTPQTMQANPKYKNVIQEIFNYFVRKIEQLRTAGVQDIIVDPGIGFGKNLEHNYTILKNLNLFKMFELPVLVGVSRKSMICKLLKVTPKFALNGTTAINTLALTNGANILRVHDVKEANEVVSIFNFYNNIDSRMISTLHN